MTLGLKSGLTRRRVLASAGSGGTALALANCGAPGAQEPAGGVSTKPLTLLWAVRGGGTPEMRDTLLAEYKKVRPNVSVEQFDASGGIAPSIEKIAAGLAAGLNIDFVNGHLAARQLIESIDCVQPIDDLVRRDKLDLNRYNKDALEATGRYDGKLYTLPYAYGGDVAGVVYNKSMFRQAGVPEPSADWTKPWTWEEFRDAMRRLTKADGSQVGVAGIGFWIHTFPMQWNARWLSNDYKTVTSDSPAMVDAFTKLQDLVFKDRVTGISPGASLGTGDAFLNGKAAVALPCCYASRYARSTKGTGVELGFITFPKGAVSTLDVSPVIMGVAKVSKQRNEAWDFLKFNDDKSRLAAVEERIPGVLPDMMPWVKQNFAEFPDSKAEMLVEGMRIAKPLEPLRYHPQWQKMATEVIDPAFAEIRAEKKTFVDVIRASKPLLQKIVDDHAAARKK